MAKVDYTKLSPEQSRELLEEYNENIESMHVNIACFENVARKFAASDGIYEPPSKWTIAIEKRTQLQEKRRLLLSRGAASVDEIEAHKRAQETVIKTLKAELAKALGRVRELESSLSAFVEG